MNLRLSIALVGSIFLAGGLASCDNSSAPAAPTGAASPPASPRTVLGSGFLYSPEERAGADPGVVTVRLGDRFRLFAVVTDWTPATLSMVDGEGRVLHSLRIDLPPGGTITGTLPRIDGWEKVLIVLGAGDVDGTGFERRIGVPEAELTTQRMREIGAARESGIRPPVAGETVTQSAPVAAVVSSEISLDPNFGRVKVVGDSYSYSGVGDEWMGQGPITDEHWLTAGVRGAINEAAKR